MRKIKFLFLAAMAASLAACSGDEHENGAPTDAEGNLIAARFSAGIGEAVPVRASGTTWAVNDKIGISATDNKVMAAKYQNVKYTVSSSGALDGETIYFQNMDEVTFTAYYPYTTTSNMTDGVISGSTVAGNQTSDNQPKIDYLFASEATRYVSPTIELQFGHRMSKIVVKFEKGNGVEQSEVDGITQYTISGLKLAGTFDTATGTAAATGSASALTITDASITSLIVYPQEVSGFTLSLSMGGSDYQCSLTVTDGKLEAGNSYTYKITVNKTGLTSAATITNWNGEGNSVESTAELLYGIDIEKHTITTYKAGVITADMITKAMDNGSELNVVGVINNADLEALVAQSKSYTTLDLSGAKGNDLTLEEKAFLNCTSLTSISLPKGLTTFGYRVFDGCTSLASIYLPTSLETIGDYAFNGCTALESITLPDGLKTIGYLAFQSCEALKSITIPDNITSIGASAFEGCIALTSITLPEGLTTIEKGAFRKCTALETITIPANVTSIEISAFRGCSSLKSIDLSNTSITTIESNTFEDCTSLESISLPDGLTTIGISAFKGCTSLKSIDLSNTSLTTTGVSAFSECTSLESITLPATVTTIGIETFRHCSSLANITCHAEEAPACYGGEFGSGNVASGCTLYVPKKSISEYQAANGWKYFVDPDSGYGGIKAIGQ